MFNVCVGITVSTWRFRVFESFTRMLMCQNKFALRNEVTVMLMSLIYRITKDPYHSEREVGGLHLFNIKYNKISDVTRDV